MKLSHVSTAAIVGTLAALYCALPRATAQDNLENLLARLKARPFDDSVLYVLEAYPADPRIGPALEIAFAQGESKRERQSLALTLLRLGNKSDKYFELLAGYARTAIEDRTPFWVRYDSEGREIKGVLSPEFENWCASRSKDPKAVVALQSYEYPRDVMFLAEAQDTRSTALFREGLDSANPTVLALSVQGLGRLRDFSAIPMIVKACEHRSHGVARAVAMQLPWFGHPEAERLMTQLVPDARTRQFYTNQVEGLRTAESKRALSRMSKDVRK